MRAGKLKHRITIQRATVARSGRGVATETWAELITVWAFVRHLQGRELFAAQQEHAEVTIKISIRYRAGIRASDRVVFGNKILDIKSIIPDPEGQGIVLYCAEGVRDNG